MGFATYPRLIRLLMDRSFRNDCLAEIHPAAFARGVSDFMAYYGMLLDTMEMRYINGFGYRTVVPVAEDQVPQRDSAFHEMTLAQWQFGSARREADSAAGRAVLTHIHLPTGTISTP